MSKVIETKFRMPDGVCLSSLEVSVSPVPSSIVLHLHANSYTNIIYTSYARCLSASESLVYLLNLRGNGASGGVKGKVDYTGQLEDDINHVIAQLTEKYPGVPIILSGHSGGTAICLRYTKRYGCNSISGLVLLAPIIQPNPEASRFNMQASWFYRMFSSFKNKSRPLPADKKNLHPRIFLARIFFASIFPFLRDVITVTFPKNGEVHDGRTFDFSYKTMKNYFIPNYKTTLSNINTPVFVSIGLDDDVTLPEFIHTISNKYLSQIEKSEWHLLENTNHINVVRKSQKKILTWLDSVVKPNQ